MLKKRTTFYFYIVTTILFIIFHGTLLFAGSATLSWAPPTTNTDGTPLTDLAGFKVYYGTSSGSYTQVVNAGNVTTYTVNNLTSDTYYFVTTAYDTTGNESAYSNEVSKIIPSIPYFNLTVNKAGNGSGTVTAAGINCGPTCTASYSQGTIVTLTASAYSGSSFNGWTGGGCSGAGVCVITMNTNIITAAAFNLLLPVADFTAYPTAIMAPLYVRFTDISTNNPTSWSWSFGDGTTSIVQNPVHTYKTTGSYTVSLTVSNAGGSNTKTKNSYITASACANQPVMIAGATPRYYSSIQAAYNAAVNGDVIEIQAAVLTGDVNINRNISVTLRGGYDCNFSAYVQNTVINGVLILDGGSFIADGIEVE